MVEKLLIYAGAIALVAWFILRPMGEERGSRIGPYQPPAPSPEAHAAADQLTKRIAHTRRPAYDPVVAEGEGEGPVSKFGGHPWLAKGKPWPRCGGCKTHMHFFAQVDVKTLPKDVGARGTGLIQVFMCIAGERKPDECYGTWEHGSSAAAVRLMPTDGPGANAATPSDRRVWPARHVVSWKEMDDYPDLHDFERAGLEESEELSNLWFKAIDSPRAPLPRGGDKVGGWPSWVQGPDCGTCRECSKPMRVILQIDSEDNVPYMFGDAGTGHVSQCPDHPHVLTWAWACS